MLERDWAEKAAENCFFPFLERREHKTTIKFIILKVEEVKAEKVSEGATQIGERGPNEEGDESDIAGT